MEVLKLMGWIIIAYFAIKAGIILIQWLKIGLDCLKPKHFRKYKHKKD